MEPGSVGGFSQSGSFVDYLVWFLATKGLRFSTIVSCGNEADLAALRQRLSAMTLHDLESFYKATHNACRYTETRAPAPAVVQEFVQAWKQLRRVKKRF